MLDVRAVGGRRHDGPGAATVTAAAAVAEPGAAVTRRRGLDRWHQVLCGRWTSVGPMTHIIISPVIGAEGYD